MWKKDPDLGRAAEDPLSLGNVLLKQGVITSRDLTVALLYQSEHGGRLGEALIEMGILSRERMEAMPLRQRAMRAPRTPVVGELVELATKRVHEMREMREELQSLLRYKRQEEKA